MRKTASVHLLLAYDFTTDDLQFPITALREIKLLKLLSHENVIRLEDMAVEHPSRQSMIYTRGTRITSVSARS
jgi:serine/threonine-protein kinase BUR1